MDITPKEKTWVYIDSFNLYYGALQKNGKRGLRWLDLESWLGKVLAGAVKIVTQDVGLKVGVLSPHETFNRELAKYATFKLPVRETALLKSQFPMTLTDAVGTFTKPPSW